MSGSIPASAASESPAAGKRRGQAFLADRVRCRLAGEPKDEPVLGFEHRARRGPRIGLCLAQPEQPRQRVVSVEMCRFRMVGHARPLQRLLGRSACPGVAKPIAGRTVDPRRRGRPGCVSRRRPPPRPGHPAHCAPPAPPRHRRRRSTIGRGAAPSGRLRPRRTPPEGDRRLHHPVEGEQSGFQRRSSEIDGQDPTHESSLLIAACSENPVRVEGSPEDTRQVKAGRSA